MTPATQTRPPRALPTRSSPSHAVSAYPTAFTEAATPHAESPSPGAAAARLTVALLAFAGSELLLISELVDRLERLEDNLGIGWFNVTLATMVATVIVGVIALIGDSALNVGARRIGHRPGARLLTPLLATAGGAALCGIVTAHLSHPLALDAWIGLSGALLLLCAAHRHAATRAPGRRPGPSGPP